MLKYLIVGSGYRAEYFGRVAKSYPALFRAMFLCRSEEKKALMTARTGIPASTDEKEYVANIKLTQEDIETINMIKNMGRTNA